MCEMDPLKKETGLWMETEMRFGHDSLNLQHEPIDIPGGTPGWGEGFEAGFSSYSL